MRDHVMFVRSEELGWERGAERSYWPEIRVLSFDPETGESSCMVRAPAGTLRRRFLEPMTEELLLLEGELVVDGEIVGPQSWVWMPGHARPESIEVRRPIIGLSLLDRPVGEAGPERASEVVRFRERGLDGWEPNPHTRYLPGTGTQTLRQEPTTGEVSLLYAALPFRFMTHRWTHHCVQEMFVLSGTYALSDVGRMESGAYAWWLPGRMHGPYCTSTGFCMLVRARRGRLDNVIDEEELAVDWDPPYRPQLPPWLRQAVAGQEAPRSDGRLT